MQCDRLSRINNNGHVEKNSKHHFSKSGQKDSVLLSPNNFKKQMFVTMQCDSDEGNEAVHKHFLDITNNRWGIYCNSFPSILATETKMKKINSMW